MICRPTFQFSVRGSCAHVALALLLVGLGGAVRAQEASSSGVENNYRSTLKDALAEYDAGHFEEARILFRRAHEINPNARTLRSIGMASFELRDYVAALRALSAALVETRKPLSAEQQTHAKGLLERSRMYVDTYTLKISPAETRVLIDGRPPELEADGSVLLGFGAHNVEVSKPGFALRTLVVNVRGGERKDLAMTLERKAASAGRPATADVPPASSPLVPPELASPSPTDGMNGEGPNGDGTNGEGPSADGPNAGGTNGTGWFLAAGGSAVLSAGAGVLWFLQNKEISNCHNPPADQRCTNEDAIFLKRNLAVGATLAAGAAAVTLAVIGILVRSPASPAPSDPTALSCAVSPAGLFCAKSF